MTDRFEDVFGGRRDSPHMDFRDRIRGGDKPPPSEAGEKTVGTGPYKCFGYMPTSTVGGDSCDIRRWMNGTDKAEGIEFQYRFLMQIGYVGEEEIRLFLPDCIVLIEGKNLGELRRKLARRQVTFVQQWSERVWPGTPPNDEAVVERIEVLRSQPVT